MPLTEINAMASFSATLSLVLFYLLSLSFLIMWLLWSSAAKIHCKW